MAGTMQTLLGIGLCAAAVAGCSRAPEPPSRPASQEVGGAIAGSFVPITPPAPAPAAAAPSTEGAAPASPSPSEPAAGAPPDPPASALSPTLPPSVAGLAAPAIVVPPDSQYVCVVDAGGERRQTPIAYAGNVAALCRKHPEMGPCQYERNACRRDGGRVYAEGGVEITPAVEAEYDRRVMRVRLDSN